MAKIHNPQDQDGIFLINQETFSEEVSARSAADTLIQSNIDAEIQNRITAVENEKTRAKEAETTLQTNINTEKERAITAESSLTTALQNEAARAQEAESTLRNDLSADIINLSNNLNDSIKEVQTLAENNGNRLNLLHTNIESLGATISEETTNREAAITTLAGNLEAETNRAKNAEQNILDSTLIYDGAFGNWETPSNRRDKATCYYFKLIPTKTGYLKSLKILCRPDGTVAPANVKTYIKVTKEDENDILGQSINALPHALGATSLYEFDKSILIESGTTYKFIFIHEETGDRIKACITSTKTANAGATPEELYGGGIQGDAYIQCQAIFEITLLNRSQVDSEKVAIIDTLPTTSDVENAISDRLINYSTTETINIKLSDYQLKSEMPMAPTVYKFTRDKNVELTFSETDEMLQDIITLTISNEGKIITANAVSDNSIVVSQEVNESTLVLTLLVNKPAESINTHIIVDSICDSVAYDNAQHICHVIPVSITV